VIPVKISILRGSSLIHVTYKNGGFSNNLRADHFALEVAGSAIVLSFDLSPNFRTRNKQENSYLDAVELAESRADLAFVELDRNLVLEPLHREWQRTADPKLMLAISLGDRGELQYRVRPEVKQISVRFSVIEATNNRSDVA